MTTSLFSIKNPYAFSVCRIEPENNIDLILDCFSHNPPMPVFLVGNWNHSEYGKKMFFQYSNCENILLHEPIYDIEQLNIYRKNCAVYIHGHSCGGTNPSLVEAMFLGLSVIAYDVKFNRETTENKSLYFSTAKELWDILSKTSPDMLRNVGREMKEIADRRYTWKRISDLYASIL